MYGDIGHGSFLFAAGLYLLWNEKKNDDAKLGICSDACICIFSLCLHGGADLYEVVY